MIYGTAETGEEKPNFVFSIVSYYETDFVRAHHVWLPRVRCSAVLASD